MDCPTCGMANPPEAICCDCGHNFAENKAPDSPGWPITLGWTQKLSSYWSITWPGLILPFFLLFFVPGDISKAASTVILVRYLVFFGIQALLTRRLVRKNYRSFRVYVVRDHGERTRNLSIREAAAVWLWLFGPQLAFILVVSIAFWAWGTKMGAETARELNSLLLWVQYLVVGPYALGLALRASYPGFRLQPYGLRYFRAQA